MKQGVFTISLDFELYWGFRDKNNITSSSKYLLAVKEQVIPRMLELFVRYDVHATWATVGFLFNEDLKSLKSNIPSKLPNYTNKNLSPYPYINNLEENYEHLGCLLASDLVEEIHSTNGQDIGTHTLSHFYCLEESVKPDEFDADLKLALKIAEQKGINIRSIVFPKHQYRNEYLKVCLQNGIECYRGNADYFAYDSQNRDLNKKMTRRIIRLLDNFINISGYNIHKLDRQNEKLPLSIPASFALRPYSPKLRFFEFFKYKRLKNAMTKAAKLKQVFHLWWHPHNFGQYQDENFIFLEKILLHFKRLQNEYGFTSLNMKEIVDSKYKN